MATAHTAAQTTAFDGADCRIYALPPDHLAFYDPEIDSAWISTEDAVDLRGVR